MSSIKSVHLQNFPNLDDFETDQKLVDKMDKVRAICSCALFVRDKNNLRVRLPLNKITIIGKNIEEIKEFSNIIIDEINVKNIEFIEDIDDFSTKKLILDFKKIGYKVGVKMPELIKATKENKWKIVDDKLDICGFILNKDEFKLTIEPKQTNTFVVDNYEILIQLDLNITKELGQEGMARDLVRIIQQFRKDANLNLSDRIELNIYTEYNFLVESAEKFKNYISEQTLAKSFRISNIDKNDKTSEGFVFEDTIDKNKVIIRFNVIK